jgi:hypothetical protein
MPGSIRLGRGDAWAVLGLVSSALVISWPILGGAYLTYVDNAVHLAEIRELASGGNGWSEIAFGGFPLATLHSPLWYPLLAWLTRQGVPLHPLYAACLVLGFLAPPVAIFGVARRRMTAARAGALSHLVLIQSPMIWGIGSPLAGMWTNAFAAALLIVLADLYARERLTPGEHLGAAFLLGLAVLTHLFVLPLVCLLVIITTGVHYRAGRLTLVEFRRRGVGYFVAALASAKYWLTFLWVNNENATPLQAFRPVHILARLLLPADPMYLGDDRLREAIRTDLYLTDALPLVLLIVLGLCGFFRHKSAEDALGRVGFWLATALLAGLLIHRYHPLRFLGPVSWRLVDWVRFGLAFSAMALIRTMSVPWLEKHASRNAVLAGTCGVALSAWWGAPLRRDAAQDMTRELGRIESLWAWLGHNARPEWGRIYLQDTFGWRWREGGLAQSHILVLTAEHTHLPQLGTYYGIVPYGLRWTLSEFNSLYSFREPSEAWLKEAMNKTNAGVLVTSSEDVGAHVGKMSGFTQLYRAAEFIVWRLDDATDHPISELTPANHVTNVAFKRGDIRFNLVADYPSSRVLAKTEWHAWWRLEGIPRAWLRESPEGFLVIDDIPAGTFSVHLFYQPSALPSRISACGWGFLAAWALFLQTRRTPRSAGAMAS